jgi:hypothetical protein
MLFTSSCGIAGEIITDVAFVVVQLMVLNWPAVIVAGEAASVAEGLTVGVGDGVGVAVGTGVGVGVGDVTAVEPPAQPAIKTLARSRDKIATRILGEVRTWGIPSRSAGFDGWRECRVASVGALDHYANGHEN